jgi:hypothetical protein
MGYKWFNCFSTRKSHVSPTEEGPHPIPGGYETLDSFKVVGTCSVAGTGVALV